MVTYDQSPERKPTLISEKPVQIMVLIPPSLLVTLEAASSLMETSKEDLILKILIRWEREQTLPLHGAERLCSLKPGLDNFSIPGVSEGKNE